MKKIKFSSKYLKLPDNSNGKDAQLLYAKRISLADQTEWFLRYDTTQVGGSIYPLPKKGMYILLLFKAEDGAIFTTLRRSTPLKWEYYQKAVGDYFEIVIEGDEV